MKPGSEQKSIINERKISSGSADDSSDAVQYLAYDRILRSLGSILEQESLMEFELQLSDDVYTIRGRPARRNSRRLSLLERIFGSGKSLRNSHQAAMVELRYPVGEILQFEAELHVLRKEDRQIPEPYGASQILRGVGGYLDKREGCRLVRVSVKDRWVTINYLARDGRPEKACQDFEYFYNYGVKMFMQRSNRCKLPPPNDPTLFVTWEGAQKRHKLSRIPVQKRNMDAPNTG
jgi:hypothetical protein